MKFAVFESKGIKRLGVLVEEKNSVLDVGALLGGRNCLPLPRFIEDITDDDLGLLRKALGDPGCQVLLPLSGVEICPPMDRPVHDILCVGVNYRDHMEETKGKVAGFTESPAPVYFSKRAVRILGSNEAIEARLDLDEKLDYEVELAVIIGKRGVDIPRERAEEHVFGYSVFNDISSRSLQKRHGQWFRGKSLDTYTAMGPVIIHRSALPFPIRLDVRSYVNDELRQSSNTELMLTDIPSLIADLSKGMTLEPGDIIATGTPAGVGMGFDPPRYLKKGDRVVCEIPPIGRLENWI